MEDDLPSDAGEDFRVTCTPDPDIPIVQTFEIEALHGGVVIGRLEAIRYARHQFDIAGEARRMLAAFDDQSAYAYGLGKAIHQRRHAINEMLGKPASCGLLGILEITVEPEARGKGLSLRLMDHLRTLHAGMPWHVALQAVPLEFMEEATPAKALRDMKLRLILHYERLGFLRPSPRGSPELMLARWNGYQLNIS